MDKPIYKSKTIIGVFLWALDIFLKGIGVEYSYLSPLLQSVGTVLAGWGIRDAISKK